MYLDHAATARYHPIVRSFLAELPDLLPNSSSSHGAGMQIRRKVDNTRRIIADALGVYPEEIYFTGSATEGNALIHLGLSKRSHVITSEVEHSSVEQNLLMAESRGAEVTRLPLIDGTLSTEQVLEALKPNTRLVSIMTINNEVGNRFQLEGLSVELMKRNIHFHRDGVQSLGKYPIQAHDYGSAVFSPHKFGSLEGVGIVYIHREARISPLYGGGGHERGLRSGTLNVPAILCAGVVLQELLPHLEEYREKVERMRSMVLKTGAELGGTTLSRENGSSYLVHMAFEDLPAEVIVNALSAEEIYVSAGSACSNSSKKISRVMRGFSKNPSIVSGSLRFSFSPFDDEEEVLAACLKIRDIIIELRRGIV